jgi:predicted anti-sigma-YlaC factor YlaD
MDKMDKLDRMLHSLPGHTPSAGLAAHIQAAIRRRHLRRRVIRWAAAGLLSVGGLWLVLLAVAGFSSYDLFSSGAPWLIGSADYLNLETLQLADGLWNGLFSLQTILSSTLVASIWLGVLLLCLAIFLAIDGQAFYVPSQPVEKYQN